MQIPNSKKNSPKIDFRIDPDLSMFFGVNDE
jgi:hypothetical protein